jgi:sulfur-oxidizing protein SoxZ
MARTLINVPKVARRGALIEIKTLIAHPMESGYRVGTNGQVIPRDIITDFVCLYEGEEIFRARFSPAVAANPFLAFSTIATRSGTIAFRWTGDNGFAASETVTLTVEG